MYLNSLTLQDFRNYTQKKFEFDPKLTLIVGPNTSGKTNLLEAVFLLATGKSFHAQKESQMIKHQQDLARVKGTVATAEEEVKLEVILTTGQVQGQTTPGKKLQVNGVSRRLRDFTGNFYASLFGPWDIELITGSPSSRRRYLDFILIQTDREYYRALISYEKGIRQRNKLLEKIKDQMASRRELHFWDKLVIKNGNIITQARQNLIDFVNDFIAGQPHQLADFKLNYDYSAISEARLAQYEKEEVAAAATLVGPHRDDFIAQVVKTGKSRDLASFGSRGEQRLAMLTLKLAEAAFIEETTGDLPVLLLDDIFSELDHSHRHLVIQQVAKQQTLLTTADPHYLSEFKPEAKVVELKLAS